MKVYCKNLNDQPLELDYDLMQLENVLTLKRIGNQWAQESTAIHAEDTGDGILITSEEYKIELDYGAARELAIVLSFLHRGEAEIYEESLIHKL